MTIHMLVFVHKIGIQLNACWISGSKSRWSMLELYFNIGPSKQDDHELEADEYGSDADGSVSCSSSSNSLEDSYETGEESASDENYDENNCDDAASSSGSINRRSRSSGVRSSHSNPNKGDVISSGVILFRSTIMSTLISVMLSIKQESSAQVRNMSKCLYFP